MIKKLVISRPLEQQVFQGRGLYDLCLVQRKSMPISDYKKYVDKDAHLGEGKPLIEIEKNVRLKVLGKSAKTKSIVWRRC